MLFKSLFLALGFMLSLFVAPAFATDAQMKEIDAKELKSWIDTNKVIKVVDARPKKYEEGVVIPKAKFLPANSEEADITKVLPDKNATIVVYCASSKCPASKILGEKLLKMGYKNVNRYPGGLEDWMEKDYPLSRAETAK